MSPIILATFVNKFDAKNFQKSPNLVTLQYMKYQCWWKFVNATRNPLKIQLHLIGCYDYHPPSCGSGFKSTLLNIQILY